MTSLTAAEAKEPERTVFGHPSGRCAGLAQAGQGDVAGLQDEPVTSGQDGGHLVEQVTGKIVDGPAHPALRMQMRAMAGDQMVRGSAVTDMQVLDHPEPGQRFQGPVDAGPVY